MKILQIHNDYQIPGGETKVVEDEKKLLENSGQIVYQHIVENSEIDSFTVKDKFSFVPNTVYSNKQFNKVCGMINKIKPDIAHVHNVFPLISPSVYYACYNNNVPIVQTLHNFRFLCPNGLFYIKNSICEKCKSGNFTHAVKNKCYKDSVLLSSLYAYAMHFHNKKNTF